MERSARRTGAGVAGMSGAPSFDEVFDQGFPYVCHVLRRLGVPRADREDRAQDVFLAVHQSLATYDPARALRPWLHGVTFHVVSNHQGLARNRREVIMDDVADPIDEALDPEQTTATTMERDLLIRLMQGLDLEHRAVVSMHIDEIAVPDIARALGIAEATAYKRLDAARSKLQAAAARTPREQRAGAVPFSLGALLAVDRSIPEVSAELRARVRSRLQGAIGALPAVVGAGPAQASAAVRWAGRVASRVGPYLVGVAVGAGGMYAYMRPLPSRAESAQGVALPALAEVRTPTVEPTATGPVASAAGVPPMVGSVTVAKATASAGVPTAGPEENEEALIQRARIAYAHGNTSSAIDALNLHARRYPRGQLAADREALRGQVLEHQRVAGAVSAATSTAPVPAGAGSATSSPPTRPRFGIDE